MITPNDVYQSATVSGGFACGGFQCSFQMGQIVAPAWSGDRGVWLNFNVSGKNANGKWVQTYVDTNTAQFSPDCGSCSSPYYSSDWSNGQWFFDGPLRFVGPVTWVAQTSYLLPDQSSAAFAFQWGFTLANGTATPFGPGVVSQPWVSQQQLINRAQGAQ
jgi:hypothetical protein